MSSDDEYTSAEELTSTSPRSSPIPPFDNTTEEEEDSSTSQPSSFEIVSNISSFHTVDSSSNEEAALPDVVAEEEERVVLEEGAKTFQLKSIFENDMGDSEPKDVRLLRENFFSKPKSKTEAKVANLMLDEDEDDTEVVECLDDNEEEDIPNLPAFARELFKNEATAAADGKEASSSRQPHVRPVHTKRYARDRIHLTSNMPIRPEDEIKEGPNVNYDEGVTVRGGAENEPFPNTDVTLHDIGLLEEVLTNLKAMGINRLRKIQQNIIPLIQQSKSDIIGHAPTGNGKTFSYLIPLVNALVLQNRREPGGRRKPSVAILLQNHETANQVFQIAVHISQGLDLHVIPATGNNNMTSEISKLRHGSCDMVIGTTGRFIQYVSEKKIPLEKLKYLVFDEAEQFVKSKEWEGAMETFRQHMPPDHRTFLFSATYDDTACFSFDNFVKPGYWFVGVGELNQVEKLVRQNFVLEPGKEHSSALIRLIISKAKDNRCPKTLVFTNSMDKADWIAGRLRMFTDIKSPFPIRAAALHSLIPATDRDLIFKAFGRKSSDEYSVDVIVASDKISCGVSTPAEIVVNLDIPNDLSIYILRVGRTGRNGHNGEAFTFINSTTMDNMPYEERKKLCCMLTSAKLTDHAPFPAALEDFHRKFTANI